MKNVAIGVLTVGLLSSLAWNASREEAAPPAPMASAPMVGVHEQSRSSRWPKVRAEYLKDHPICEACGSAEDIQVHHVLQFRSHPERELDLKNLITLCGPGGHGCHERIGHAFLYKCANPHVREDAALQMKRIEERDCK